MQDIARLFFVETAYLYCQIEHVTSHCYNQFGVTPRLDRKLAVDQKHLHFTAMTLRLNNKQSILPCDKLNTPNNLVGIKLHFQQIRVLHFQAIDFAACFLYLIYSERVFYTYLCN